MPESLLRVLACGGIDDGKSTMIGRLLVETGGLPDDLYRALERDSRQYGTVETGVDYALLVDGLAAEREQGITIDLAWRYFETDRRRFILADAPGHEQYTRNMASGASRADLAILVVDARKGMTSQTRRHAAIASLMGVRNIVLAVNKMDLVGFSADTFATTTGAFEALRERLNGVAITCVPICARDGDNVTRRSRRMEWHSGPTLLQALEEVEPSPLSTNRPFRMRVQSVLRDSAGFRGYSGTLAQGTLRPGDRVVNATSGVAANVSRIVGMEGDRSEARPGDAVTVTLHPEMDVSRGDMLCGTPLPAVTDRLIADIVWFDETPLFRGRDYLVMLGPRTLTGAITEIMRRLDMANLQEAPARVLRMNDVGRVVVGLAEPVAFEPYTVSRELGSFIFVDRITRATVGAGVIRSAAEVADVRPHRLEVQKAARAAIKGQRPAVLWFTGLSGAGKSTIANLVEARLHAAGFHTFVLDGDNIRRGLCRDLGFTEADRVENIRRVAEVAKLFAEAGLIVLVSFISPYRAERMLARERVDPGEFIEIFVDTPLGECERRDPKGLYAKAKAGEIRNFTGIDAPYEPPEAPELHLRTLEATADELADQVLALLREWRITS
jgi:bifunctional enzyme CysN/CysC